MEWKRMLQPLKRAQMKEPRNRGNIASAVGNYERAAADGDTMVCNQMFEDDIIIWID